MFTKFENMPADSRLWIYQTDRLLSAEELDTISKEAENFTNQWTAHNNHLKASFKIEYNCFLLLAVDENIAGASGCSIDKSVHFIHQLENKLSVSFFNRILIPFLLEGGLEFIEMSKLNENIKAGILTEETITFDNVITRLGDLEEKWKIASGKSWLSRYFKRLERVNY